MTDAELVERALQHDPEALRALEERVVTQARRIARIVDASPDEIAQLLRERLHVDGKLKTWDGSGTFDAWLRTVAIRAARNANRGERREVEVTVVPEPDPELRLLKLQYREHFRAAFETAMKQLSADDRTVLRLHTLDGLSLGSIGTMFHKDGSNISRWLARIREALREGTKEQLRERLRLDESALESVMRVADSELTMSLSVLLR